MGTGDGNGEWERGMGTENGNGEWEMGNQGNRGGCKTGNQVGDNREYIKEAQITFM